MPKKDDPLNMFVIVRRDGALTMWLASQIPRRWSDHRHAVRFATRGEARRVANSIKLSGDWSVEADEVTTENP
jgi:hypothetical protein